MIESCCLMVILKFSKRTFRCWVCSRKWFVTDKDEASEFFRLMMTEFCRTVLLILIPMRGRCKSSTCWSKASLTVTCCRAWTRQDGLCWNACNCYVSTRLGNFDTRIQFSDYQHVSFRFCLPRFWNCELGHVADGAEVLLRFVVAPQLSSRDLVFSWRRVFVAGHGRVVGLVEPTASFAPKTCLKCRWSIGWHWRKCQNEGWNQSAVPQAHGKRARGFS